MGISGISRPYVGQNAQNIQDVKAACDKKTGDVTAPPRPEVHRAWAFELAADGTSAVPPPPAGRPGRDPLVIELGQIEVGTRIELISLSDNPQAEFDEKHKGEIFELPLTGYDVSNRTATIALNEAQMKEKGVVPGERLMLRQVDKDGNASEAVHLHLDPNGWANQQFNEPVQGGGTQRIQGRHIDIATGVMGLDGNPNPGKMERVLGKSTRDEFAPKLLEQSVSVVDTNVISPAEMKKLNDLLPLLQPAFHTLFGNHAQNHSAATLGKYVETNKDTHGKDPSYKDHFKVIETLAKSPELIEKLATAINGGTRRTSLNTSTNFAAYVDKLPASFKVVQLDRALEPGASISIQNSRTGDVWSGALGEDQRTLAVQVSNLKSGDPLIITYRDAAGNAGKPYAFNFDEAAKDGKARTNPLDIRLGAFSIKPPAKDT